MNVIFPLAATFSQSLHSSKNKLGFIHCPQNAKYVWNKADFDAVDPANTDFLMGKRVCFNSAFTEHELQGQPDLTYRAESKNNTV